MKLLVFAHTPPPHHGQSYMVQLMLAGFGGNRRRASRAAPSADPALDVQCFHVNARLSQRLEDIGDLRIGKFILLVGYCLQAIWCRFRHGVTTLYYIPAPGKRSALYRDWLVMLLCRPFFKRLILHWHAAGLAKWLETVVQMRSRSLTYRLMKQVDLSIVLSNYNRADAEKLFSQRITVISNGIPDPCTDFREAVLPRRQARFEARKQLLQSRDLPPDLRRRAGGDPETVRVLYLAHCTREKGLFDALVGVARANRWLAERQSPLRLRLEVAGNFVREENKADFDRAVAKLAQYPGCRDQVQCLGFVSGEQKTELLRHADLFCFPTYYENENQPVNLIEAMAYGLPILTTRWRSLPELFPPAYPGLVDIRSPDQIAKAMVALMTAESGEGFRDMFLSRFTLERHLRALSEALHSLEQSPSPIQREPIPALEH